MGKIFILVLFITHCNLLFSQQSKEIKFYKTHELNLNTDIIKSHRIEFKEISYTNQGKNLESYTYVTVDPTKQFGEEMILINWMAVTKFGTGLDINYVSKKDLSVRYRLTPKGLPWGHLIESHAFKNEVHVIEVNADVESHIEEIKKVYPSIKPINQKPAVRIKHDAYNAIIWPYVLATMNLKKGMEFILPGFNTYANKQFYHKLKVKGLVNYKDINNQNHIVYLVEGEVKLDLDEADDNKSKSSGSKKTAYYVSTKAPYFYGKTEYIIDKNGRKNITKSWTLSGWQLITINPNDRITEMLYEWNKIQKEKNIIIPWTRK